MNRLIVSTYDFPSGALIQVSQNTEHYLYFFMLLSFAFFFFSFSFFLVPAVCTGNYRCTKYVARKTLISNDVAADSANRGS